MCRIYWSLQQTSHYNKCVFQRCWGHGTPHCSSTRISFRNWSLWIQGNKSAKQPYQLQSKAKKTRKMTKKCTSPSCWRWISPSRNKRCTSHFSPQHSHCDRWQGGRKLFSNALIFRWIKSNFPLKVTKCMSIEWMTIITSICLVVVNASSKVAGRKSQHNHYTQFPLTYLALNEPPKAFQSRWTSVF